MDHFVFLSLIICSCPSTPLFTKDTPSKETKGFLKKHVKIKGILYLCYNLSYGPHFLLKSSLSVEVKCESTE